MQLLSGCYGNRVPYGVHLNDTIRLPDPENKGIGANSAQLFFYGDRVIMEKWAFF